jgi:hypothetical protein
MAKSGILSSRWPAWAWISPGGGPGGVLLDLLTCIV